MSVYDVASGAGLATISVAAYEQGLVLPNGPTLERLATVLEMDAETLAQLRLRSKRTP